MKKYDNLFTEFIIEYYSLTDGRWLSLYSTRSRKLAIYQLDRVRKCFPSVKYRLFEKVRIK